MEKQHNIKYVVKVISVTKGSQKIHFSVRHPENAFFLSGLAVTTNVISMEGLKAGSFPFNQLLTVAANSVFNYNAAGKLALAIPNKGDVFYSADIRLGIDNSIEVIDQLTNAVYLSKMFAVSGKRQSYFETHLRIEDTILEGFYEDQSVAMKAKFLSPYKVTLYLRYQLKTNQAISNQEPCN